MFCNRDVIKARDLKEWPDDYSEQTNDRLSMLREIRQIRRAAESGDIGGDIKETANVGSGHGYLGYTDRNPGRYASNNDFIKKLMRPSPTSNKAGKSGGASRISSTTPVEISPARPSSARSPEDWDNVASPSSSERHFRSHDMNTGILYAAAAYALWGVFPIYFKALQDIPPMQIMVHRIVWSFVFVLIILAFRRQWKWIGETMRRPKVLAGFAASAVLLSTNWFIYIWAVNNGRVIDSSLGYFINPLVNILLGYVLLRERLRGGQWLAVAIAAAGVLWLTWQTGGLPWIGLSLALTFGTYGLLRKTGALGPLEGLSLETLLLFPFAFGYLALLTAENQNAFLSAPAASQWLLAAAGPITAIPLLLFAAGARRISMATLGILQYIGPSLQLLCGVLLYGEPFSGARVIGFALIWSALAVYTLEGLWQARAGKSAELAQSIPE